jgi:hypothetical protein
MGMQHPYEANKKCITILEHKLYKKEITCKSQRLNDNVNIWMLWNHINCIEQMLFRNWWGNYEINASCNPVRNGATVCKWKE